ncbi:MAG: hypothetical protein AB1414_01245 [bacterium]
MNSKRKKRFEEILKKGIGWCKDCNALRKIYLVEHENFKLLACEKCHKVLEGVFEKGEN